MLAEVSRIVINLNLVTYCFILSVVILVCYIVLKAWQRYLKWFCSCSQRQPVTASTMIHFVIWDGDLNAASFPLCRIPSSYSKMLSKIMTVTRKSHIRGKFD